MLVLSSTSDLIRLTNTPAADLDIHASWVDKVSDTAFTPGRTNTKFTTAQTNATIVGNPSGTDKRNVKSVSIRNIDLTDTTTVTVEHTDGTNAVQLQKVALAPGEALTYNDDDGWGIERALLVTLLEL